MLRWSGAVERWAVEVGDGRRVLWVIAFVLGLGVGVVGANMFVQGAIALGIMGLSAAGVIGGVAVNRLDRARS
jgi:hypothetical protein